MRFKKPIYIITTVVSLVLLVGCNTSPIQLTGEYKTAITDARKFNNCWQRYSNSLVSVDSVEAFYHRTCNTLTQLSSDRDTLINGVRYVLMTSWKGAGFTAYLSDNKKTFTDNTGSSMFTGYPLFLTTNYDLEQSEKKYNLVCLSTEGCNARLTELLGLTPNPATHDTFIEFWVRPADILRPAIDSDITVSSTAYKPDSNYVKQFSAFSAGSYQNTDYTKDYPFTGLGYTYDYNPENKSHIGVSEFVLKKNRKVFVRRFLPTTDYLVRLYQ